MTHDILIIGAGIVGLSTALKIKENNPELDVVVLEKENEVSLHQTGNNSGVIHSGIYYRPGSLKAKNCIEGYRELLSFCDEQGIPYDLCGKLVVATDREELPRLEELYQRGLKNGLTEIKKLTAAQLTEYEPHVQGVKGLFVPYTGIVDYFKVSDKIRKIFEDRYGGKVRLREEAEDIIQNKNEVIVRTGKQEYKSKLLINTAGLFSDRIAVLAGVKPSVRIIPFRGEYYKLVSEKEYLVKNLIYPVPDPKFPFLGVHFTRMMRGGVEAGPNAVFAFSREGYRKKDFSLHDVVESLRWPGFQKLMMKYAGMGLGEFYRSYNKSAFTHALQKLVPEVQKSDLAEGGSGVRAQACDREGNLIDDFLFVEDSSVIHVLNSPSPAATASLSIGKTIAGKALERFNK